MSLDQLVSQDKRDIIISEQIQPKIRESLEAQVMPTTKIIKDLSASDTEIFVESANLFRYEQDDGNTGLVVADGFIVNQNEPVAGLCYCNSINGRNNIRFDNC